MAYDHQHRPDPDDVVELGETHPPPEIDRPRPLIPAEVVFTRLASHIGAAITQGTGITEPGIRRSAPAVPTSAHSVHNRANEPPPASARR